uniref:Uncharacterized protein n=1 Tax=Columba livia TaxID=8932 RepID=R7VUZ2_COLLI
MGMSHDTTPEPARSSSTYRSFRYLGNGGEIGVRNGENGIRDAPMRPEGPQGIRSPWDPPVSPSGITQGTDTEGPETPETPPRVSVVPPRGLTQRDLRPLRPPHKSQWYRPGD